MRLASVLSSCLVALAACGSGTGECPGTPLGDLSFSGARVAAGDPSLLGLDPVPLLPDCEAAVGHPDTLPAFRGTVSAGPSPAGAALCRDGVRPMFGTRSGDRIAVETTTGGAVLKDCGGCPAELRLVVAGDVLPGGPAPATGFSGALLEILSPAGASCAPCTVPCAARYSVTGVAVP